MCPRYKSNARDACDSAPNGTPIYIILGIPDHAPLIPEGSRKTRAGELEKHRPGLEQSMRIGHGKGGEQHVEFISKIGGKYIRCVVSTRRIRPTVPGFVGPPIDASLRQHNHKLWMMGPQYRSAIMGMG